MSTCLLIDADIVAYKVSVLNQKDYDWGDTGSSRVLDFDKAMKDADEIIAGYSQKLKCNSILICLSDPDRNFRKELNPLYKASRVTIEKPELLQWVKDYLAREYRSFIRPRLEADDVMGIISMKPALAGPGITRCIIVSEDKDMRTIPVAVYNPGFPDRGVQEISYDEACRFHLYQVLIGDPTDGYPGCPGIGPANLYVQYLLEDCPLDEMWDCVVEAYASKGFTEEDAILQARMAHILWYSSYNMKEKKVRLWQPYWI